MGKQIYASERVRMDAKNARRRAKRRDGLKRKLRPNKWMDYIIVGKIDECWEWTGSLNSNSYPQTRFNGKTYKVHRLLVEWVYGFVDGPVHHTCQERRCVNPMHLLPTKNTKEHMQYHKKR